MMAFARVRASFLRFSIPRPLLVRGGLAVLGACAGCGDLLGIQSGVYLPDGSTDSGVSTREPDASLLDASLLDASLLDASLLDASALDASALDATVQDASRETGELDGPGLDGSPPDAGGSDAIAESGTLDQNFGDSGVLVMAIPNAYQGLVHVGPQGLAIEPNGQIVFCGNASLNSATLGYVESVVLVGRLDPDGRLDKTFGPGGFLEENFPGSDTVCRTVRLLDAGSAVLGGFGLTSNGRAVFAAKLTPEGGLDPTFGDGGSVYAMAESEGTLLASEADDFIVTPNDELLFGGLSGNPTNPTFLELSAIDGTPVGTFGPGGDGFVTIPMDGGVAVPFMQVLLVALLPNGDVLAPISSTSFFAVALEPDGSIDSSYAEAGTVSIAPPAALAPGVNAPGVQGIVVEPDGKVVLAGATGEAIVLARLDVDGELDTSFGSGGVASFAFPGSTVSSLALTQDQGFAVAAGLGTGGSTPGVVRFDANGEIDTGFGGVGYVTLPTTGSTTGEAIAVDSAGRIVLAATIVDPSSTTSSLVVARFWP